MKKYDSYKDSGVEWIGEVPSHWEVMKTSLAFVGIGSGTTPSTSKHEFYDEDNGKYWLQTGDLNDGIITETSKKITNLAVKACNLKFYPIDSIVIAMYGATIGKVGILGIETATNQACCVLSKTKKIVAKYAFYEYLACKPALLISAIGGGQPNISQDTIKKQKIAVPPLNEQYSIATYLDKKCSDINKIISVLQKRITLLQELKQSVITHAVTKGLNPNVEMKDSGVEWIGEIPRCWNVVRLKNECTLKGRIGWNGLRSEEFEKDSYAYLVTGQDFISSDIDWSKCYQINKVRYDEDPFIQLENGDLLITKDGTIGKIAKVSNMDKPACLNSGIFVLKQKSRKKFVQGYLYWSLYSDLLKDFNAYTSTGTTILHLYQNVFENMPLTVPSLKEQQDISDYLERKTYDIDVSVSKAQHQVDLLLEYKQSLITEVVTGKRKVC